MVAQVNKLTQVSGLGELTNAYDTFLIDQFGVLHDGVNVYPQTIETLKALKALGKTVVIVSNSGKRSASNIKRMALMGIYESLYDHFVTSGDVAHQYLLENQSDKKKQTCFLISRNNDTSAIDGLDLTITSKPDEADIIIISGSEGDRFEEAHYVNLLRKAASEKTLCLCTNPDKKMLTPNGLRFGAGRIAELYEEHGGDVLWIGKPHKAIYTYIFSQLKQGATDRILCVGDSIEHDIAGGKSSHLNTLLVRTGIASGISWEDLQKQFYEKGITPDYLMAEFRM